MTLPTSDKNSMLILSNKYSVFADVLHRSSNPRGHVYQTLLQAERDAMLSGKSVVGDAQMINITLDIKCQQ